MKHRVSAKAICPYYLHEDTQVVYCEGIQRGSVLHLAFANRTYAKEYKESRCQRDWKKCPMAQMLTKYCSFGSKRYIVHWETCFDEDYDRNGTIEINADSSGEAEKKSECLIPYHSIVYRVEEAGDANE